MKTYGFVRRWMGIKLPEVHYKDKTSFVKKFFFHPIKRRLARCYLIFLQKFTNLKVIAITGSAGKTTTKEMLSSVLKQDGLTVYTKENIDPVYNIPTTILRTLPWTKYLVLEMGVEYPDEMDFYLWLAKPDVGIITNIFPTHTAFLNDVEGVFNEKKKLIFGLSEKGVAVLNSGDERLKKLKGKLRTKIVWFSADIDPFVQNHNAAYAAAEVLKISKEKIEKGLSEYKNPPHRLALVNLKSGAVLLDDSYNSNPWAAVSTLNYFNSLVKKRNDVRGKKIAVLGDMLELGDFDEEGHRLLGREVAKSGFKTVIGVGKSAGFMIDEINRNSKTTTFLVPDVSSAILLIKKMLNKGVFVLVKGSRSIGLDKLVEALS